MAEKLDTKAEKTWCPGCPNFLILESVKRTISKLISEGNKQEDFAIATGIGCHGKIFDYLNLSGINGLHGRAIPTGIGMKLGNPKLKVLVFSGDGDCYAEGIAHFIHACRYNADMTLIVHNNQTFALTTGQSTPVSQEGFKTKIEPKGEFSRPLNPLKLALVSGASFVARCSSRDIEGTSKILEKAVKHRGFSFVEIIQPCLQFNTDMNNILSLTYKIDNEKNNIKEALELADKWNYNSNTGKIPIGIFYKEERKTLDENISSA